VVQRECQCKVAKGANIDRKPIKISCPYQGNFGETPYTPIASITIAATVFRVCQIQHVKSSLHCFHLLCDDVWLLIMKVQAISRSRKRTANCGGGSHRFIPSNWPSSPPDRKIITRSGLTEPLHWEYCTARDCHDQNETIILDHKTWKGGMQ
jgi:hypothetical protein